TASRRTPYPLDRRAYKRRNLIERMFRKLKNWRRIATRYDRYAQNYLCSAWLPARSARSFHCRSRPRASRQEDRGVR
ncbi:MAG TPA: hypothetical protein VIH87_09270, partial [Methylocella sp.]